MIYRPPSIALRTSLFYAIGTALWILLSDQALALFVSSPQTLIALETYKGWAFVGVTALLLYIFLRRQFYDLEHYVIERKQKEETLRQSEYRFRMLFEQNNDAIFLIDLERVVLMANQRAAEMFGYRLNEFIGMNIQQLVAPETREQTHNVMNRLLAREKIPVYERQFIKKDGTRFLAEVNVDMVRDLQGKPLHIQSILRDITRRKQAEETVRRRAEELNALQATLLDVTSPQPLPALLHLIVERAANLLRSSSGGLYVTEPEYHRVRCVVSYKTKRDYTGTMLDYGVGAAGHVAQSGEPLIIDDYVTWSGRAQMFEDDQPFQSVMSAPLLWQGSVTGVIHILRENTFEKFTQEELDLLVLFANHAAVAVENARLYDALDTELSERVQAEAASQQSQAQLAGIVTSAIDAIISINAEQRIVLFNPAAETVFRCAAAEAIGQPLEKFVPERFRASHAQHVRDFASSGITNRSLGKLGTVVGVRSDGVEFPIEASISQTHIVNGDLYTVILRDITERVRTEENLRESEERYRQLFENSPIGIYRTTPDGRIIASNTALVGMLGFSSFEELAARNLEHDSSDAAYSRRFFKEQIERDDHITGLESVWHKHDGTPIFIRENAHTIRDETGAVLYYDGTIEDITER
ncbi:MAG: MEKHLA domain-containing protein, partial [Chloroflexi bacterium]|nr:MEKHLA domain-containing protein [Chloroflexota bacterium]